MIHIFLQKEKQIGEGRERELKFLCCLFVFDIQSLSMVTFCNVERERVQVYKNFGR
jgi:hypothetical protein